MSDTPDYGSALSVPGSGLIFSGGSPAVADGSSWRFGPFYVGNYGRVVSLFSSSTAGQSDWVFRFLNGPSGGLPIDSGGWVKVSTVSSYWSQAIKGPYLVVDVFNHSGANQIYNLTMTGISPASGDLNVLGSPVVAATSAAIAAAGTVIQAASLDVPGPAVLCGQSSAAGWNIFLQAWLSGAWQTIGGVGSTTVQVATADLVIPAADLQVVSRNGAASTQTLTCSVVSAA